MKVDLEELSLLYDTRDLGKNTLKHFHDRVTDQFPAILAKLKAAQRLRAAAANYYVSSEPHDLVADNELGDAIEAFDKETE